MKDFGRCASTSMRPASPLATIANSYAGPGAKGQCVVHTTCGTILWMAGTKRLYSPNPQGDLLQRLGMLFQPWSATCDASQTFSGRWPAVATSNATHLAAPIFATSYQ